MNAQRNDFRSLGLLLLAGLLGFPGGLVALDGIVPSNRTLQEMVTGLSAERFAEREAAARELERLGPDVFPLLKRLLEETADQELRLHLRPIIKRMALVAETDPEALARYAREEAEARRFTESSRLYARAAHAFHSEADKRLGEERAYWEKRARRAAERATRAEEWARALLAGQFMEQAGRSFVICTQPQINGQAAVQYREIDLRSLTDW